MKNEKDAGVRFKELIMGMDIPVERREPSESNLRWFIRNAWIRNKSHPNFDEAFVIAKENS